MTTITKVSLQITETGYTVFTEYKSHTGSKYDGFTPYKTLAEAKEAVNEAMNLDGMYFVADVEGYTQITFPNNDNNAVRTFIEK
tara:strand:+ start:5027 stop:5278 length:252 start_codon:yes stop_codon:yes gene_type:complete